MKALKLLLSLLVGLAAAFLLIGVFVPQIEYRTEITIDAPVEKTFAIYMDETRMGEWLQGFVHIENLSGLPGEVGSQWRLAVLDDHGVEIEFVEEVTAYEANRRFAFAADGEEVAFDADTLFEPAAGGTRVTVTTRLRGKDWFLRSLMPLYRGQIEEHQARDFENLKRVVETSP